MPTPKSRPDSSRCLSSSGTSRSTRGPEPAGSGTGRHLAGSHDFVGDLIETIHQPEVGGFARSKVGFGHTLDPTLFLKAFHLPEVVGGFSCVDAKGLATVGLKIEKTGTSDGPSAT